LKEKVQELQELFSQHTYEELQTIKFELSEPKKEKPKRKYAKKKKEPEKPQEEPVEENNEVTVMEEVEQ
jgi:hypothetical protein